jgi:hypothetical protein
MRTVIESTDFQKRAATIWPENDYDHFIEWIAKNPDAGVVIPGGHGVRKIRWSLPGSGKRGGARVIYIHYAVKEAVLLLTIYAKSERDNISLAEIERILP